MDLDHKLCYCYHISKRKVVNFVKQTRPKRASQISECFGAGSGCGWCVPFLIEIHRQIVAGEAVERDDVSPEDYESMRKGYLSDVKEGSRERNRYGDSGRHEHPVDAEYGGGSESIGEEALDYTKYFSRSRPEPLPDDVEDE